MNMGLIVCKWARWLYSLHFFCFREYKLYFFITIRLRFNINILYWIVSLKSFNLFFYLSSWLLVYIFFLRDILLYFGRIFLLRGLRCKIRNALGDTFRDTLCSKTVIVIKKFQNLYLLFERNDMDLGNTYIYMYIYLFI